MPADRLGRDNLFTAPFLCLFAINTVSSAGFYMTMPTLPKYALKIGMSLTGAGVLTGIFSVAAIVVRPFAGYITDRFNKKWVLSALTAVMALVSFAYSISQAPSVLYLWRVLHGAAFAGTSTLQLALAAGIVPEKRRGEGLGYIGMTQILAMSFAPNLGLWAAAAWGYPAMFRLSAAIVGAAAIGMAFLPWKGQPAGAARHALKWKELFAAELALLALMGSLFSFSNSIITSYLSMLADERGIMNIGLFFTVSSAAVLLSKPVSGRLMDRRGLWFVLKPCIVMGAAAMLMVAGSSALWPLLLAAALKGIAQSSGQSALQAECVNRSDALRVGVAMSTCYLGNDLGQGIGNVAGGALSSALGYAGMFTAVGIFMLSGLLMVLYQRRMDNSGRGKYKIAKGEANA